MRRQTRTGRDTPLRDREGPAYPVDQALAGLAAVALARPEGVRTNHKVSLVRDTPARKMPQTLPRIGR